MPSMHNILKTLVALPFAIVIIILMACVTIVGMPTALYLYFKTHK